MKSEEQWLCLSCGLPCDVTKGEDTCPHHDVDTVAAPNALDKDRKQEVCSGCGQVVRVLETHVPEEKAP